MRLRIVMTSGGWGRGVGPLPAQDYTISEHDLNEASSRTPRAVAVSPAPEISDVTETALVKEAFG